MTDEKSNDLLGRGLQDLMQEASEARTVPRDGVGGYMQAAPEEISTGETVLPEPDASLVQSVADLGMLQPILVRRAAEGLVLVSGRRRLSAARAAGLDRIPVRILETGETDDPIYRRAENLDRASPPEKPVHRRLPGVIVAGSMLVGLATVYLAVSAIQKEPEPVMIVPIASAGPEWPEQKAPVPVPEAVGSPMPDLELRAGPYLPDLKRFE